MARLFVSLAAAFLLLVAHPAAAAVTITFWSHELGNHFPHAFFTLRGVPDAGGAPVDANFGFTANSITPAILFGPVPGRIDIAKPDYMDGSDAQFAVVLTDAQYADVRRLIDEWDAVKGDGTYRMNTRNCVHFVAEAIRRAGVPNTNFPKLMKKPRSFLKAVADANPGRVVVINQHGKTYLASLPPIAAPAPVIAVPPPPAPPPAAPVIN